MVSWTNGSITLRFRFLFAKIVFTTALPPYDPSSFFHFSFSIFHVPFFIFYFPFFHFNIFHLLQFSASRYILMQLFVDLPPVICWYTLYESYWVNLNFVTSIIQKPDICLFKFIISSYKYKFFWRDLIKISGPNHSYYYTLDLLWKLWFLESIQSITAAYEVGMLTQLIINITISSIVTGFKKLLFSTNLLARLLSDCSINQSYSKL